MSHGNNYLQDCFQVPGKWMCIGQSAGGMLNCTDVPGTMQLGCDFATTWPMRFTNDMATCDNLNPDLFQSMASALGCNRFIINQQKIGSPQHAPRKDP